MIRFEERDGREGDAENFGDIAEKERVSRWHLG
jgi:hypothetical protein